MATFMHRMTVTEVIERQAVAPPAAVDRTRQPPVNRPSTVAELDAIRRCVIRGKPAGSANWIDQTARELGLESTRRSRGRPKKSTAYRVPQ